MSEIKEVIFFCYGDSSKASTWSNVPFLFTKELEDRNITVRRVSLLNNNIFFKIYNQLFRWSYSLFYPNHSYEYIRSSLYRKKAFAKIKKAVNTYKNADCCIFTCFDFWNKFNTIPTILFCDWTYEILILDRQKRKPYSFEKRYADWQEEAIDSSDIVISMFPECAHSMKKRYPKANVHYLGSNVVNNMYDGGINVDDILKKKKTSKKILFIGGRKYKKGCALLIKAYEIISKKDPDYELNIIGMNTSEFINISIPNNVHFYGYLKKDNPQQCHTYYNLLINAALLVNPTEIWAGYSSTIEAMYFYTPIIVSPYKDFVAEFGSNIDFGCYNYAFTPESLSANIVNTIMASDYLDKCLNAHYRTKDYTWSVYVTKILDLIKNIK